jgi:hypothetical protein
MHFVVRDLMISVLPLRPLGGTGGLAGCEAGACTPCSDCSKCTLVTPGGHLGDDVINPDPTRLAALKQQLQAALSSVESREKVVLDSLRPKSVAEIEFLRGQLTAALEDLERNSNELTARDASKKISAADNKKP